MNTIPQTPDYRVLSLITAEQAHKFRIFPIEENDDSIECISDTSGQIFLPQLTLLLGKSIDLTLFSEEEVEKALIKFYPFEQTNKTLDKNLSENLTSDVVQLVDKILSEASEMNASDIHIERYEEEARVRFRWEGELIEKHSIPLDKYNALISRIKIMADLDISEKRLPQDGRIHFQQGEIQFDTRVSTLPSKYGEKAVLRLLQRSEQHLSLRNLNFTKAESKAFHQAIHQPNGIILITGPTGSGKTTTLYATLQEVNKPNRNIMTVEDPIEYNLTGINQVQVKDEIGLSFSRTLRAFLRQDPDIIMVGEIRDTPTAEIAIRAALTGHLVLSTLHTNSAWDAIVRLGDMGIEPYLLAASLRMVVAQRLVRVLCSHCKESSNKPLFKNLQESTGIRYHFLAKGCPKCFFTGYKGRTAVFEILPIEPELAELVKEGKSNKAVQSNLPSLRQNLINLVREGKTSFSEIITHLHHEN